MKSGEFEAKAANHIAGAGFMMKAVLVLLVYNFVFPIRLRIVPGVELALYSLTLFMGVFHYGYLKQIIKLELFLPVLFLSLCLLALGSFSILYNGSNDYLSFVIVIKYLFALLCSYILVVSLFRYMKEDAFTFLLKVIVLSSLLIAVTCLLEFFVPSAKAFFAALINTSGNIEYDTSFRVHGLATGGGASLSVGLAIGSVLALYLSVTQKKNMAFWAIVASVIYISCLFVGRTGFYLLSLFYVVYILSKLSVRGFAVVLLLGYLISVVIGMVAAEQIEFLFNHGFEPFKNYMESGRLESKTTNAVMDMYYFPDWDHMLLGAGFWRYATYDYYLSDSGYMKVLLAFGIFGFIVFYSTQLYLYSKAFFFYQRRFKFTLGFTFVFFVLFLTELKEAFFVQNYAFKMILLLILLAFTHRAFFSHIKIK